MDKSGLMKVATIQTTCGSNQGNPDEDWHESKNCDTIQQGKTQDQKKNQWYKSRHFDSIYMFYDSKNHELNQNYMINKKQGQRK